MRVVVTVYAPTPDNLLEEIRTVSTKGSKISVGRGPFNDVVLPDSDLVISKSHCDIRVVNGAVLVVDLSTNGTFLNGSEKSIGSDPAELTDSDSINIGSYTLRVHILLDDGDSNYKSLNRASMPSKEPEGLESFGDFWDDSEPFDLSGDCLGAKEPASQPEEPHFEKPTVPASLGEDFPSKEASAQIPVPPWRRGNALFRVPRVMWTETAELAELRLSSQAIITVAMQAALENTMKGRGNRTDVQEVSMVGRKMRARLFGEGHFFKIEALSTETQDIVGDSANWDWRILPIREGHGLLTLRISMVTDLDGREISVDAEALHNSIEVTVKSVWTRPTRFVRDNWRWLLGSSGVGAFAAIWALFSG